MTKQERPFYIHMSKEEQEAYNALSEEDQAIFMEKEKKARALLVEKSVILTEILLNTFEEMSRFGLLQGKVKTQGFPFKNTLKIYARKFHGLEVDEEFIEYTKNVDHLLTYHINNKA